MVTGQPQRINVADKDGVMIVEFRDAQILDDRTIQQLGTELMDLIRGKPTIKLLLNFTGVTYLSSAALGKLITVRRRIDQAGGQLKLCEMSPETLDVFKISKLDDYFEIYPSQRAATDSLV
jgi:anti-sigma B factor antagonist